MIIINIASQPDYVRRSYRLYSLSAAVGGVIQRLQVKRHAYQFMPEAYLVFVYKWKVPLYYGEVICSSL
jgi:hypothetical protein